MKNFITLDDFSQSDLIKLIGLSAKIKKSPGAFKSVLEGKHIGLLFEKPSLRTKTVFYIGALQLGAGAIYYTPAEVKLGEREKVCDVAKTLSLYLDAVVLRTFSHNDILEFTKFSSIPVVNGLSDLLHPSQALADVFTIQELKGQIDKVRVGYIGDGNNVCNSLLYAFSILGGKLTVATPSGYLPAKSVLGKIKSYCRKSGADIKFVSSVREAANSADILYTDAWTSMGREKEAGKRKKVFKNFQINDKILKQAKKDCKVMHCLPAHRGQEITDSVIDGKNSAVFLQAANRLHAAKAILTYIFQR
jgi:ornithine carbamoyltransferase